MKSIRFFFASVLVLVFAACSRDENEVLEDNSSTFESMVSLYGIQAATSSQETTDVPSITTEEMGSVLETLRRNGHTVYDCETETIKGFYGNESDRKIVKMTADYQARTRSGALVGQFELRVSLSFNIDKGAVYYIGTAYSSSTDLFGWHGYGASLSTTADGVSVFNSTAYLYFRVSDHNNSLVKVPVYFKGSYRFGADQGTYSFSLSKMA